MRRIKNKKWSKKAITLVELIVAMTLTAIFASSCILLILPITQIYRHVNDLSRAELLADTVVDALRTECADTYISCAGDVWIASAGNVVMTAQTGVVDAGPDLVIRKSPSYCETIATNYAITNGDNSLYSGVLAQDREEHQDDSTYTPITDGRTGVTTRAIYRMFESDGSASPNVNTGYLHFGYYLTEAPAGETVYPSKYYDFTNPFSYATYGRNTNWAYTVALNFHWDGTHQDTDIPSYILCDVSILNLAGETVYSRTAVLCFASQVS